MVFVKLVYSSWLSLSVVCTTVIQFLLYLEKLYKSGSLTLNAAIQRPMSFDENDGKTHELHFELLLHPPYSPDSAPSKIYQVTNLKKMYREKNFDIIKS